MILYHFTYPEVLDAIMKEGLVASNDNHENDVTFGRKVVWFISNVESWLTPTLEFRQQMLKQGQLLTESYRNLPQATVCLSVRIGSHDRKLVHYFTWFRKHHPENYLAVINAPITAHTGMSKYWIYLGNVPPSKLTVFKHFPQGDNSFTVPHIQEACQKARLEGAEIEIDEKQIDWCLSAKVVDGKLVLPAAPLQES